MRKLERTLREMKMESLWPNEVEDSEHIPPPRVGWSNLLHQELNQDFHRDWDMMDWRQEFAPELVTHLMGDQRTIGNQSGHSISSPMFSYSQKNFHISDGNLYSVLSPFQSRKSTSRPTFLRGQPLSEVMSTTSSSQAGGSSGNSEAMTQNDPGIKGNRNRRVKLKFHEQNIPAQYRTSDKNAEAEPSPDPEEASSQDRSHSSTHRSNRSSAVFSSSSSSLSSSFSKSLFSEKKRDSFFKGAAEDEFDLDNIFSRGRLKDDPFEALDLSKPHDDLFKRDWMDSFTDEFDSSYRLRKSHPRRSIFEDSDNDDDEPLNLCIADHVKKHRHKGVPIKVKREPVDYDSDSMATPRQSPFSASRQRFERSQRSFFANHSPSASIFRSPSPDISFAKESANSAKRDHNKVFYTEKDEALDLSFKKQQTNEQKRFYEESISSETSSRQSDCSSSASSNMSTSSFKLTRGKKVPYISEMLENMSLWDEDSGQPLLKTKPRETQSSVKKKNCAPPHPTKHIEELVVPSWKKTVEGSSSADAIPTLGEQKMTEGKRASEMHQCNKSSSDSDIRLAESKKVDVPYSSIVENVPGPNYYVLLPSPLVQPYGMTPTFIHPNVTATTTPNKPINETITIQVPSIQQESIKDKTLKDSASSLEKTEIKPKNLKPNVIEDASKPLRNPGPRQKRLIVPTSQSHLLSDQSPANDISICKFKLIKGVQPMLEEKKSFFVPLPRTNRSSSEDMTGRGSNVSSVNLSLPQKPERFKTYKIHVGSQEEIGKKLAAGKKIRRRSRKTLVREKLEATFREQGFLIKTQQVSSAEGAVYCKFRQLKKFTRYLFKSWRNYLPKDLEEISTSQSASSIPSISLDPALPPLTEAALSLPDIPTFAEQLYSPSASRCSSFSGTSGLGTSILSDSGPIDNSSFVDSVSVDGASMVTDNTNLSDSCLLTGISPCPSTSSLPCASPSSSSIT